MGRIGQAVRPLLGWTNVFGAAVFVAVTVVLWVLFYEHLAVARQVVFVLIPVVAVGFAWRRTRRTAAGFVFAFVIMTPLIPRFTAMWWRPVTQELRELTRPLARWSEGIQKHRDWVDARRGHPLEVKDALVLLNNLQSGCIPSYSRPAEAVPEGVAAIFRKPDCDRFESSLVKSTAKYPARYFPSDTGWRWDYARSPGSTDKFRVVLRPDPLLELQGPIIEVTGDGWYRVRANDNAPPTMLRTPVPMMKRLRECIPLAAASVDPKYYPVLWEFLSNPSYIHPVCRDLLVEEEPGGRAGGRIIYVRRAGVEPDPLGKTMLQHLALSPGRFEIRAWSYGRRYLLDADGVLHAASALGLGTTDDGPAQPCELEPGRACT